MLKPMFPKLARFVLLIDVYCLGITDCKQELMRLHSKSCLWEGSGLHAHSFKQWFNDL